MPLHMIGKRSARWKDATTRSTTEDRIVAVTPNIMIVEILLGIETFPAAIALIVTIVFAPMHQLVPREMCPPSETLPTLVANVALGCLHFVLDAVMTSDMIIETTKCGVDLIAIGFHAGKCIARLVLMYHAQVLG